MNENVDLTKILKDCPNGWKFYSSVYGEVEFDEILSIRSKPRTEQEDELWFLLDDYPIQFKAHGSKYRVSSAGKHIKGIGECTFFPSREQRDWSKFTAPWYKKEKFDPKTLQTLDKVLVRTYSNTEWNCDLFSTMLTNPNDYFFPYIGFNGMYKQCIPLNDETKHLIGTRDEAPEFYRHWEN